MTSPKHIRIQDYQYDLPDERIARYPLAERDQSKLLIYRNGEIKEDVYRNISSYLPESSVLFFNNTKVIEARLYFQNTKGQIIEIFCLEPHQTSDISIAMSQTKTARWKCLVGRMSRWKEPVVKLVHQDIVIEARIAGREHGAFIIDFQWTPEHLDFAEVLHATGQIPIPPYLNRKTEASDAERYQTTYAQHDGSVAAPTAGLHFTPAIFQDLKKKGILHDFVTLHVGAGTFKPVKAEHMQEHDMHAEFMDVSVKSIEFLLEHIHQPIVSIGTTTTRTLESLYWIGVKCFLNPKITIEELALEQWEAYDLAALNIPVHQALQALKDKLKSEKQNRLLTKTSILIAPCYSYRIVKVIGTNFHQPESTLMLLVAAAIGENWKKVYQYALAREFRFLSYGDGSLLFLS